MKGVYNDILAAKKSNKKLLTILIDPEKTSVHSTSSLINKVNQTKITHIFVGGSTVEEGIIDGFISEIKKNTELPILIFPGNVTQISNKADALLFLSLNLTFDIHFLHGYLHTQGT